MNSYTFMQHQLSVKPHNSAQAWMLLPSSGQKLWALGVIRSTLAVLFFITEIRGMIGQEGEMK